MHQLFYRLFTKYKRTTPPRAPTPRRQARLGVESLEKREVMTAALGAAALHQAVPTPSAPAQVRTITAAPTTQNQAATQVGSQNAASPVQNQDLGGALKNLTGLLGIVHGTGSENAPPGFVMEFNSAQPTGRPGEFQVTGQFVLADGTTAQLDGTVTDQGNGTASVHLESGTASGQQFFFDGSYNINTSQMTGQMVARSGDLFPWSGTYTGIAGGHTEAPNAAKLNAPVGQPVQQLPGQASAQLGPQAQVGTFNTAAPIQHQDLGGVFGSQSGILQKVPGGDSNAPSSVELDFLGAQPTGTPGQLNVNGRFVLPDGQIAQFTDGTVTDLHNGTASVNLDGVTDQGVSIIGFGTYNESTGQMTMHLVARSGDLFPWSADYTVQFAPTVGSNVAKLDAPVGQSAQQLPGQAQNQLSPQQQSDALMVRPLSSPQMALDIQQAVLAHARATQQTSSSALS